MAARPAPPIPAEQVEALVAAGGALVRLASQSLTEVDARVSLIQFRALLALSEFGTMRATDLAGRIGAAPASVTRLCDRLVASELIRRVPNPQSRREVLLTATANGRQLVHRVIDRRRRDMGRVLAGLDQAERAIAVVVLRKFAALAAGLDHEEGDATVTALSNFAYLGDRPASPGSRVDR